MSEEKDSSPSGKMGGEEKPVSELRGTRRQAGALLGVHRAQPGGKEEAARAVWVGPCGSEGPEGDSGAPGGVRASFGQRVSIYKIGRGLTGHL